MAYFASPGSRMQSLILAGSLLVYELGLRGQASNLRKMSLIQIARQDLLSWIPKNPSQHRKTVPSRGGCGVGVAFPGLNLLPSWDTNTNSNHKRPSCSPTIAYFVRSNASYPDRHISIFILSRSSFFFIPTPCVSTSRCGSARQFPPLARVPALMTSGLSHNSPLCPFDF